MNRQIRREQERKQDKQDKEKEKKRSERRKRREAAKKARERRKASGDGDEPVQRSGGRKPGRFSGALAVATVFFILLQAVVPTEDTSLLNTFVSAGFYLLFGYFGTLWLLRRETPRAVMFTLVSGAMLGAGVELGKYLQPQLAFDPLLAALILPGLVLGALLGRLVYYNAPA